MLSRLSRFISRTVLYRAHKSLKFSVMGLAQCMLEEIIICFELLYKLINEDVKISDISKDGLLNCICIANVL